MLMICVVVAVDNPVHSDFVHLRNMLVRTHMQDLKDVTQEIHYENYRAQWLYKNVDNVRSFIITLRFIIIGYYYTCVQ